MRVDDKLIADFVNALLSVDRNEVFDIASRVFKEDSNLLNIEFLVVNSLQIIGDGWENGDYALAQIYLAGIICEELMDRFINISNIPLKQSPKMGIGVFLDNHALGKRIVLSVIKSNGYEILDLGEGLNIDQIVELTIQNDIEILLISTLMLSSALKIRPIKERLESAGKKVKIIAGGAPFRFDPSLWTKLNIDADGKNATDIIDIIEKVVNEK